MSGPSVATRVSGRAGARADVAAEGGARRRRVADDVRQAVARRLLDGVAARRDVALERPAELALVGAAGVRAGVDDVATKYSDSPYILYSVAKKSPIIVDSASAFEAADVQSSSTNNYFKSWH